MSGELEPKSVLSPDAEAEQYVASLMRALGYQVKQDVLVDGHQIDVIAEKHIAGYGKISVMLEVKQRNSDTVKKDDVVNFVNTANSLIQAGSFTRAIMVASTGYTRFGKAAVEPFPNIQLMTLHELEREFLALEEPLKQYVTGYEERAINYHYVDLVVKRTGAQPAELARRSAPKLAATALADLAVANPKAALLLFADYGAGKTTTLERIKATTARAHLGNQTQPLPVLFYLKDLNEETELDSFVEETLRREFMTSIPKAVFWDFVDQGRFLLLLDGFDEITLRADREVRQQLLSKLAPLLFGASPSILSSRPSYFINRQEYTKALLRSRTAGGYFPAKRSGSPAQIRLSAFTEGLRSRYAPAKPADASEPRYISFELSLLTNEQVDEYLRKFEDDLRNLDTDPTALRSFLNGIYDLSDLIRRPIILDMVVFTVLDGKLDVTQQTNLFGPSDLYAAYTDAKLSNDWDKASSRQSFLPLDARQQFAERCAVWMLNSGTLEIPESEVSTLARAAKRHSLAASLDEVLTDLRTCSFLTISPDGSLRFVHRSFQEFFAARSIQNSEVLAMSPTLRMRLPREVLYFLGGFAFSDPDFFLSLIETSRAESRDIGTGEAHAFMRSNLATAVLYSRERLQDLTWNSLTLYKVWRRRLEIERSSLQRIVAEDLRCETLSLVGCTFKEMTLNAGQVRDLSMQNCSGDAALSGSIGSIAATGGDLEIHDRASWSSLGLSSCKASLRLEETHDDIPTVSISRSECSLNGITMRLSAQHSRLHIAPPMTGIVTADIRDCAIDIDARLFIRMDGAIVRSIVSLGEQSVGSPGRRSSNLDLTDTLLTCDRGVPFSSRGLDMRSALVFGGKMEERDDLGWQGVLFHERKPMRSASTDVGIRMQGAGVVIEGYGQRFKSIEKEVSERVRLARQGTSSGIAALTRPVETLAEQVAVATRDREQLSRSLDRMRQLLDEFARFADTRQIPRY